MAKFQNVLVVDDNKIDRLLSTIAVQRFDPDITTLEAKGGLEALDLLKTAETPPDLILLDINMPQMSGKEFLEIYARCAEHKVAISMVTASDDDTDKSACLAYPFVVDYLVKPIDPRDLEQITLR